MMRLPACGWGRLTACAHIGIFLRSFHSHSTHYARETIAKICSMGVIALRSPCSAQARSGHPWPLARRMRLAHGHPREACVAPS
jgi:hypothetical protein